MFMCVYVSVCMFVCAHVCVCLFVCVCVPSTDREQWASSCYVTGTRGVGRNATRGGHWAAIAHLYVCECVYECV